MAFFEDAFGFSEDGCGFEQTHAKLNSMATRTKVEKPLKGEHCLLTLPNGRKIDCGTFSEPTLEELRDAVKQTLEVPGVKEKMLEAAASSGPRPALVTLRNSVGEARSMHSRPELMHATIQAASQFNYLEFAAPNLVPERGISIYEWDRTQGPACAIACAGGTAYRNYLMARQNGKFGQRADDQCNGLELLEKKLQEPFWEVRNGYVESTAKQLEALNKRLHDEPQLVEELKGLLRIGVQADVQVTDYAAMQRGEPHLVTQTYNSALSIGYSDVTPTLWTPLAKLVLDASYEATLLVGILNAARFAEQHQKLPPVLLTKVGGGVFGNSADWIQDAIVGACTKASQFGVPLDVSVVHYGTVELGYNKLPDSFGHSEPALQSRGQSGEESKEERTHSGQSHRADSGQGSKEGGAK
jgi:hypothetical protein